MILWERLRYREPLVDVQRTVAWAGVLTSGLTAVVALVPLPSGIGFLVLLAFACVAPGAACVCHVRLGDPVAAWAVVLVLSMSLSAIAAVGLTWAQWWEPVAGLLIIALLSAASCAFGLLAKEPPASAGGSPVVALVSETTVLPQVPAADETPVLRHAPAADETAIIPRVPAVDETAIIPRVPAADETVLIPRFEDATMMLPQVSERPAGGVSPAAQRLRRRQSELALAGLGLLAVWFLWTLSLPLARIDAVNDYGLLSAMPATFFAAIAVCALAFTAEVARRRPRAWVMCGHTVLLVLMMHATVPILVREPEYAWTYKHLGIIDLIAIGRPLANAYDVYQQWPAFFALVAQLTVVSGLSVVRVASWAPVFFGLANLLPVYAIARTLTAKRRVPYIVVFLFTATNWVAQDYLAPQAFAFTLCLGMVLMMLRWLRRDPIPPRGRTAWLNRLWAWVQTGVGQVPYTSGRTRKLALIMLYVVYTAVTVSHQLSPYLIAMSATVLIAFRLVQPVQIVPMLGVIAVLQLIPRYRLVESWGLFDGFNLFANAQPLAPTAGAVSAGRTFSTLVVQILALTVWLTATLVVVANRRRLGPFAVPAALAAGPFAVLLGNSYGGEAIFRVFLFSSPWCAYLIAVGVLRLPLSRRVGVGLAAPALAIATLAAIQGEHGQLMVNRFTSAEIRAAQYLYANIPSGGAVVMAGSNFPDRISARYTDVLGAVGATDTLLPDESSEGAVVVGEAMNQADLDAINSYFDSYDVPAYLVLSRGQANAARYFGYFAPEKLGRLRALLETSPRWTMWYLNEDTQIFRYVPDAEVTP